MPVKRPLTNIQNKDLTYGSLMKVERIVELQNVFYF